MSCTNGGRIVGVPIIVEPVVVPVPLAIVMPLEVENVTVAIRIAKDCIKCLPYHHPSNALRVVSYPASQMP